MSASTLVRLVWFITAHPHDRRGYSFAFLTFMDYNQDVLGVQVGATIWMCYENDVLGLKVGATKKIGYEKDVLEKAVV